MNFKLSTGLWDWISTPHGLTRKCSYVPLHFFLADTYARTGAQTHMFTNTFGATPTIAPRCVHPQGHTHTLWHATQPLSNPWQIKSCSYVKWIKLCRSKSAERARKDNSQAATCSKANNQLCVSLSVCVDVANVIWTGGEEGIEFWRASALLCSRLFCSVAAALSICVCLCETMQT